MKNNLQSQGLPLAFSFLCAIIVIDERYSQNFRIIKKGFVELYETFTEKDYGRFN